MFLIDKIKQSELYKKLSNNYISNEGNLLNITNARTMESQLHFFIWSFLQGNYYTFLETGTNQGMFAFLLDILYKDKKNITLYTFDINPQVLDTIDILNNYSDIDVKFFLGDTKETLPAFTTKKNIDFMWLDGHHTYEYVMFELEQANRLGIDNVAVDDTKSDKNLYKACEDSPYYKIIGNPYWDSDERGAILLKRV